MCNDDKTTDGGGWFGNVTSEVLIMSVYMHSIYERLI
jgi:hypothetical protein